MSLQSSIPTKDNPEESITIEQQQQVDAFDLDIFFEEEIGPKTLEYFASVRSANKSKGIKSTSTRQPANIESTLLHSSSNDLHVNFSEELRKKREESIVKIISRIEKKKPDSPAIDRLRFVASALVIASILFVLQHFDMLPGISGKQEIASLRLLSEINNSADTVVTQK